jgi:hypothetical protein
MGALQRFHGEELTFRYWPEVEAGNGLKQLKEMQVADKPGKQERRQKQSKEGRWQQQQESGISTWRAVNRW